MLPEVAAEALRFLSRRDLDKACAVSKWLDSLIAQCFEVYPLRPVFLVTLGQRENGFTLQVRMVANDYSGRHHSFGSIDEAAHFAGSLLRNSYVETFQLGERLSDSMPLSKRNWTTLIDTVRSGAVWRLRCINVDCSALDDDAFLVAVGSGGLKSFCVGLSIVPLGLVTDDLFRSGAANGLLELCFAGNRSGTLPRFSDDALLDFCFPVDAPMGQPSLRIELAGNGITDMFLAKFLERLRSSPVRPSGHLRFTDAPKQSGLSPVAHYLAPNGTQGVHADATYRFPVMGDNNQSYEVGLSEHSTRTFMQFSLVKRSS